MFKTQDLCNYAYRWAADTHGIPVRLARAPRAVSHWTELALATRACLGVVVVVAVTLTLRVVRSVTLVTDVRVLWTYLTCNQSVSICLNGCIIGHSMDLQTCFERRHAQLSPNFDVYSQYSQGSQR